MHQLVGVGGGGFEHVDSVVPAVGGERFGVGPDRVIDHVEFRFGDHPEHGVPRCVEAQAGDVGHRRPSRLGPEPRGVQRPVMVPVQVGEGAVGDAHALGPAGGAGGVEDVGQIVSGGAPAGQGVGSPGSCGDQLVDGEHSGSAPGGCRGIGGRDHDGGVAVFEDDADPFLRVGQVHREDRPLPRRGRPARPRQRRRFAAAPRLPGRRVRRRQRPDPLARSSTRWPSAEKVVRPELAYTAGASGVRATVARKASTMVPLAVPASSPPSSVIVRRPRASACACSSADWIRSRSRVISGSAANWVSTASKPSASRWAVSASNSAGL